MDLGRVGRHVFVEAAGVGLVAGLLGYFKKLDTSHPNMQVVVAALRFVRQAGMADVLLEFDGGTLGARTQAVSVANSPYVGDAFAVAPGARLEDGLLDVTLVHRTSLPGFLLHLALMAGGRAVPPAPHTDITWIERPPEEPHQRLPFAASACARWTSIRVKPAVGQARLEQRDATEFAN